MADHLISDFFCQAESGVAGKNILPLDRTQKRLHLIVHYGKTKELVVLGASWGVGKPLADFLAAPVNVDVRRAPDVTPQR
jgi:hypothetical protein